MSIAHSSYVKANNEIYDTIVQEGSIPLNWTNDSSYPWTLEDGYLKSGNFGHKESESKIAFSYSSQHTTNISFKYQNNRIIIMPGAGVNTQNALHILKETRATEIHGSLRVNGHTCARLVREITTAMQ